MPMGGDAVREARDPADPSGAGGAALFLGGRREESAAEGNEKRSGGLSRRRKGRVAGRRAVSQRKAARQGAPSRRAEGNQKGPGGDGFGCLEIRIIRIRIR